VSSHLGSPLGARLYQRVKTEADFVGGAPFRVHPDVREAREHGARDMTP
jgi:hypothetical protein